MPADPVSVPRPSRSPWQGLYGGAHRLRRTWYRSRAERLPRPVISVGNLAWGGTGKTPIVSALAAGLSERGRRVAILSRGYKGKGKGVRLVSSGSGPMLGPLVAGDEPVLLASELAGERPGIAVVVGPDRYSAGLHALERLPEAPDVFLLDDGFSHLALHRDLDLLVFPASDPFAGGRLPPGGKLREPLASSRWAHALLLSGGEPHQARSLAGGLRDYRFSGPGFACSREVLPARVERDEKLEEGARVLLVTGIARPQRVRRSLEGLPYEVIDHIEFPDHYRYPDDSLRRVEKHLRGSRADWVLTTGKDHVKLLGRLEAPLALLPLRARPEDAFWSWLERKLEAFS